MRNFILATLILIVSISFFGCKTSKADNNEKKPLIFNLNITKKNKEGALYLDSESRILDLDKGEILARVPFRHNAQYSLSYYDINNEKLYYMTNTDRLRKGGDQLFCYDVKTKKEEKLTDNIYATNYIIPVNNEKLFLVSVASGTHSLSPAYYNIREKKFTNIGWDDDFFTFVARKDMSTGGIFVSGYSDSKERKAIDKWEKLSIKKRRRKYYAVTNHIYRIEGNKHIPILKMKRFIGSFAVNRNKLLLETYLGGYKSPQCKTRFYLYDIEKKKLRVLRHVRLKGSAFIALDDKCENYYANTGFEIIKGNLKTGKKEVIYTTIGRNEFINNAQFIDNNIQE